MDGDAEAVTDGVTDGAEHGGAICAPDGAPPSGSADSVEGCGVQLSTGLQLADPGEEAEDGTGMGVGVGVGVGMGVGMGGAAVPNGFPSGVFFLIIERD